MILAAFPQNNKKGENMKKTFNILKNIFNEKDIKIIDISDSSIKINKEDYDKIKNYFPKGVEINIEDSKYINIKIIDESKFKNRIIFLEHFRIRNKSDILKKLDECKSKDINEYVLLISNYIKLNNLNYSISNIISKKLIEGDLFKIKVIDDKDIENCIWFTICRMD